MSVGPTLPCCMVGLMATAIPSFLECSDAVWFTMACLHVRGCRRCVQTMMSLHWLRQACWLVAAPDCLLRGACWDAQLTCGLLGTRLPWGQNTSQLGVPSLAATDTQVPLQGAYQVDVPTGAATDT